jgi:glyoxylase-like metal-dependent hydrolase (beta-lactamase superfamily II)
VKDSLAIESIADDLFMLRPEDPMWPSSANVFVIRDGEGFSMIDVGCGRKDAFQRLTGALSRLGLSLENLDTLVLSHAHPDHMGGAKNILDASTPTVFIHAEDSAQARDPRKLNETFDITLAREAYSRYREGAARIVDVLQFFDDFGCSMSMAEPDRIIREGETITLGRYSFEVIHTPGHSPGHISLFDERSGIMYGGDLVGEIVAWYTPTSGGVTGYLESLDKLEQKNPRIILPSHGHVITDPVARIAGVLERLLAREEKLIDILSEGPLLFPEVVDRMFKNETIRFFPGTGITESHIQKLIGDGKVRRNGHAIGFL